jgi:hypothetical protein
MAEAAITGSMLYNLVSCPRRVELDLFGDQDLRDPIPICSNAMGKG